VVTDCDDGVGIRGAEELVARLLGQQLVQLPQGLRGLVALDQGGGVVVAGRIVVGRLLQHRCQQNFRVIEDVELHADASEEPHRLHVVAVL
jgi:hypothetical protein